ncbi:MAG: PadR family transcriptional regulator [Chloroflexi bacterium]|nr:PadR family transcriptional regulator [Chloroflexota bacterium]MBU1747294.1 PadR family transcriptional regulator [Chloroflexota bacterium]MBU1877525.1 PadR family transcriptional regulator [Chloroflexota bacterium]
MKLKQQLRKGSTETLILTLLNEEPMYGYQIARELEARSKGYFQMKEGLLYPALHQMEEDGLVHSEWRAGQGARRRKYYLITAKGHRVLADSVAEWQTFAAQLLGLIGDGDGMEAQPIITAGSPV